MASATARSTERNLSSLMTNLIDCFNEEQKRCTSSALSDREEGALRSMACITVQRRSLQESVQFHEDEPSANLQHSLQVETLGADSTTTLHNQGAKLPSCESAMKGSRVCLIRLAKW